MESFALCWLGHFALVDERRRLEQCELLDLVATLPHKLINRSNFTRERAADARDARDWEGATVRLPHLRRRDREPVIRIGDGRDRKRATRTFAPRGCFEIVVFVVCAAERRRSDCADPLAVTGNAFVVVLTLVIAVIVLEIVVGVAFQIVFAGEFALSRRRKVCAPAAVLVTNARVW